MFALRVLVFAEYGWRNGGENSWLSVAQVLQNQGVEFSVATPVGTEFARHLATMNIPVVDLQFADPTGQRKTQIDIRIDIQRIIEQHQPDLVHANSLASSRLVGPVTSQLSIPALGYLRDIIKISRKAMSDINCLDTIVAVSAATLDYHRDNGLDSGKSIFIHNGVDLQQFQPRRTNENPSQSKSIHNELGLPESTRTVLCIGQIGMRKGTDCVIKAFKQLSTMQQNLALLIVGMRHSVKDEAVEFEKQCIALSQSESNIHWLGRRSDVTQLMQDSDLLLHGARQEPLGRVLLEALGCGLPFVATNVGGTSEIVPTPDLQSQTLVPSDVAEQMAIQAAAILTDKGLIEKIGKEFRQLAKERFDIQRCADQLLAEYKALAMEKPM